MGNLIDNFCCINTNVLLEHTDFIKNSINNSSRKKSIDNSVNPRCSLPSSELKFLPIMEIGQNNQQSSRKKINSKNKLPISTKNLVRKIQGNPSEDYKLLKKLGNGTFGQVYKVMHKKTGNIRAMKIIPKNNLRPGFSDKEINREINIMKNLDHPHIIKIYEFYSYHNFYYLINEYCTEGDLSEKMDKLNHLPEPIVKILMAQIFSAVLYLNKRGVIHGDLKLENILVDSYLDDGNIENNNKSNFISSLIKDAKNVQSYLRNLEKKKLDTAVFNRKKIQEKLSMFKKSDKTLDKFQMNNKIYLYENPNNIINEETKECEINNEERKDNYELEHKEEDTNIFGFQSNDDDNEKSIDDNDSSDFSGNNTPPNSIFFKQQKNVKPFSLNENSKISEKSTKLKSTEINCEQNYLEKPKFHENITKKKTYNYSNLNIKNFELKLIDFGCSKIFSPQRRTTFEDTIGTLVYCSPEVLNNHYDQKCDVWSCGVIMYILLSGKFPFYGKTEEEITKKILFGELNFNNKYFDNVSENAKDLISKCLIRDKSKRISVKEALNHEFFKGELDIKNIFEDEVETKNVLNNLKINSRQTSKFYQIVLTYLSYNFADKEHLQKLRNIFYKIDLNMDGKLSKEELYKAYKEAGIDITKEQLQKIMRSMDFDGNGYIEYEEFIRVTLPKEQLFTDINLKNAFDMFDKDKNGTISFDEILEVIGTDKELDKNVIEDLKMEVSYDGNKEIDFKHFKDFMLGLKNENN